MAIKSFIWLLAAIAFTEALFSVVAWTVAAKTGSVDWVMAGNASLILSMVFGTWAAIWYSIHYINHDD